MRHRFFYVVGIASIALAVATWAWDSLVSLLIISIGLVIGIVDTLIDRYRFGKELNSLHVLRDPAELWRSADSPLEGAALERWEGLHDVFWVDPLSLDLSIPVENGRPALRDDISITTLSTPWDIPSSLGVTPLMEYAILRERQRKGKVLLDDRKVRLASDPDWRVGNGPVSVTLQPTTYFKGIVTNEFAHRSLMQDGRQLYQGWQGCLDSGSEKNRLAPLSKSHASNHIGVSMLMITSDFVLVLLLQSRRSNLGSRQLVATGSGSMDWSDVHGAEGFLNATYISALRETTEECPLPVELISRSHLTGYARVASRGGKPELNFVSFLSTPWAHLSPRVMPKGKPAISRRERAYILTYETWDLGSSASAVQRLRFLRNENRAVVSSSLDLGILLLMKFLG